MPEVPEQLAAISTGCLAKDPADRFATPAEVAEALAPWCNGADLPALLQRARLTSPLPPGEGQGEGRSVSQQPAAKPPLLLTFWGWKWFVGQLILLLMAGSLGFALGILIRIEKDGKTTSVEVPAGSSLRVGANSNVDVTLPAQMPESGVVDTAPPNQEPQGKPTADTAQRSSEITHLFQEEGALRLKPADAVSRNRVGLAMTKAGIGMPAIKLLQEAVEIKPDFAEAHNNIGYAWLQPGMRGHLNEAIEHLEKALSLRPDYADAHKNLGQALVEAGRQKEAIEHFQQALRLRPDDADTHYRLGCAYSFTGDHAKVIEELEQCLRLNPNHAEAQFELGAALAKEGRLPEAIEHFREAARLRPHHFPIYDNMAEAYARMNQMNEATAAAQKALEIAQSEKGIFGLIEPMKKRIEYYKSVEATFHRPSLQQGPNEKTGSSSTLVPNAMPLQFGPAIERVVNLRSEGKGSDGIDLASGKLVDLPKEFGTWPAERQRQWCEENNVDLTADRSTDKRIGGRTAPLDEPWSALVPENMKLAAVTENRWYSVTRPDLDSALEAVWLGDANESRTTGIEVAHVSERRGITSYTIFGVLPVTFAFQTRKGDLGILQVIRFTEEPRGIRIRYKLVQPPVLAPAPAAPTPWPLRVVPPPINAPAGNVPYPVPLPVSAAPAFNPAAEFKAIAGAWKVVSIEKGDAAESLWRSDDWGTIDFDHLARLTFDERYVRFQEIDQGDECLLQWVFNPRTKPKTIGLFSEDTPNQPRQQAAVGTYELIGDRLKICLAKYLHSLAGSQGPTSIAVRPNSGDILLTLQRYRPSADEKALQGKWTVVSQTDDGKPLSAKERSARSFDVSDIWASLNVRSAFGMATAIFDGLLTLDPAKQPNWITIRGHKLDNVGGARLDEAGNWLKQQLLGIYKFDGDQLTIAYRNGGTRPETFESKPGSGVTLLVLER